MTSATLVSTLTTRTEGCFKTKISIMAFGAHFLKKQGPLGSLGPGSAPFPELRDAALHCRQLGLVPSEFRGINQGIRGPKDHTQRDMCMYIYAYMRILLSGSEAQDNGSSRCGEDIEEEKLRQGLLLFCC